MGKRTIALYLFATLVAVCDSFAAPQSTVHLKGQLKNMGTQEVIMRYNGATSALGDSRDILINTDAEGNFDIVFKLSQPEYYSISRNTLYLTPGDDMTVKITTSNNEAEFTGKGAEANTYMKKRLFPKAGSFLEAGENIKADFVATMKTVDSLAMIRTDELKKLSSVSAEFKILEKGRIDADVINSNLSYLSYSNIMQKNEGGDQQEALVKLKTFVQSIAPKVNKLYKQIATDKFLNVEVVRDVLSYFESPEFTILFKGITLSNRTKELFAAANKVGRLNSKANKETAEEVKIFALTLKNKDFADELNRKTAQVNKLFAGSLAPDLVLQTIDGQTKKLSDFKGNYIYIDFWATWCGPCIRESPYFEELSKKYVGKEIVFLPISTDTNKEAWLGFLSEHSKNLTQYCSQDGALKRDWDVSSIPRFILINKDFKIIEAHAPSPSSKEISGMIDTLLQK